MLSCTTGSGSLETQAQHLMLPDSEKFRKKESIHSAKQRLEPAHNPGLCSDNQDRKISMLAPVGGLLVWVVLPFFPPLFLIKELHVNRKLVFLCKKKQIPEFEAELNPLNRLHKQLQSLKCLRSCTLTTLQKPYLQTVTC